MDKAAKDYLTDLLISVRGNMEKAALIADYDRAHFYVLVRRHNIDWRAFRPVLGDIHATATTQH